MKPLFFKSFDNISIRYSSLSPGANSKGRIVAVPGRTEFLEKYSETAEEFVARGYDFWTFDLRGQGGSDRLLDNPLKGHIESVRTYVKDLQFFTDNVMPASTEKTILLSHSTGGLAAIFDFMERPKIYDAAIFISPFFSLNTSPLNRTLMRLLARCYVTFGCGEFFLPGQEKFDLLTPWLYDNDLTSDRKRYERNLAVLQNDQNLAIGGATANWLNACFKAQLDLSENVDRKPLPALSNVIGLFGGEDRIVDVTNGRKALTGLGVPTVETIPNARHELLQENDSVRLDLWGHLDAFLTGLTSN
ncbi:alpha/beta fold hydrolase [Pseudomonadota bacterium]